MDTTFLLELGKDRNREDVKAAKIRQQVKNGQK